MRIFKDRLLSCCLCCQSHRHISRFSLSSKLELFSKLAKNEALSVSVYLMIKMFVLCVYGKPDEDFIPVVVQSFSNS